MTSGPSLDCTSCELAPVAAMVGGVSHKVVAHRVLAPSWYLDLHPELHLKVYVRVHGAGGMLSASAFKALYDENPELKSKVGSLSTYCVENTTGLKYVPRSHGSAAKVIAVAIAACSTDGHGATIPSRRGVRPRCGRTSPRHDARRWPKTAWTQAYFDFICGVGSDDRAPSIRRVAFGSGRDESERHHTEEKVRSIFRVRLRTGVYRQKYVAMSQLCGRHGDGEFPEMDGNSMRFSHRRERGGGRDGDTKGNRSGSGGLDNGHNICFMNAVLQMLFHTELVRRLIDDHRQHCLDDAAGCIWCLLQATNLARQSSQSGSMRERWRAVLEGLDMKWGEQQSAVSFAILLIDMMRAASVPEAMLFDNLTGYQVANVVAKLCQNEACVAHAVLDRRVVETTRECLLLTNVDVERSYTITEAVAEKFQNPQGETVAYCDACQRNGVATTTPEWAEPPKVLMIGIPRGGSVVDGRARRNSAPVDIQDQVELCGRSYSVTAVVEHLGGSADGGHYVAWAASPEGWTCYDDMQVSTCHWLPVSVASNVVLVVYLETCDSGQKIHSEESSEEAAVAASTSVNINLGGSDVPLTAHLRGLKTLQSCTDGSREFETLVGHFLAELSTAECVEDCLRNVPVHLDCFMSVSLQQNLIMFEEGLRQSKLDGLGARREIEVFLPLWRTMPLRMAIVFEALSRLLSLPTVMLWEAFKVTLSSLLHKDLSVAWQDYDLRQRYWAVVTSDPGAGKSPALKFIMGCLQRAMVGADPVRGSFPGFVDDNFHIVNESTHAAFAARLNRANGYSLLAAPEASTTLSPKYPTSGEISKSSHVDLEKLLEGANGGAIHWDTQADVLSRPRNGRGGEPVVDKGVHHQSTNLAIVMYQQISMLQNWWAQAEARYKKGLANRFVFSTGRRPVEVPMPKGMRVKLEGFLSRAIRVFTHRWGCMSKPGQVWQVEATVREAFLEARAIATEMGQEIFFADDGVVHSMLEKIPYWLSHESLMAELLERVTTGLCDRSLGDAASTVISELPGKLALQFVYLRLARGYNMLDVEIARSSWKGREGHGVRKHVGKYSAIVSEIAENTGRLLRACTGRYIYADTVARYIAKYRWVFGGGAGHRRETARALREIFEYMSNQGYGRTVAVSDGWPIFEKTAFTDLSEEARQSLTHSEVPLFSFVPFPPSLPALAHKVIPVGVALSAVEPRSAQLATPHVQSDRAARDTTGRQRKLEDGGNHVAQNAGVKVPGRPISHVGPNECVASDSDDSGSAFARVDVEGGKSDAYVVFRTFVPRSAMTTYVELRREVEHILGEMKDPGIWTFKDGGVTKSSRWLRARCSGKVCRGCTRELRAKYICSLQGMQVTIFVRGAHGVLERPQGTALWNAAEQFAIETHCSKEQPLSGQMVKEALKKCGLSLRCDSKQLWQWISRERMHRSPRPASGNITILELRTAAEQYAQKEGFAWCQQALSTLVVVGKPVVDTRVCIIWTSRGMLQKIHGAKGKLLKILVDGKQKVVSNEYGIVTLSFLVPSASVTKTWAGPGQRGKMEETTGTAEPFVQALVSSESSENMEDIFRTSCDLARSFCGLDLERQVIQVHKDFAKGIAKAKKIVFPSARPCDDFPHMMRAARSTLLRLLGGLRGRPKAKAKAVAKRTQRKQNTNKEEGEAEVASGNPWIRRLMKILSVTRILPTVQLFDAIWRVVFDELRRDGQHAVVKYLMDEFIAEFNVSNLAKNMRVTTAAEGRTTILFAGFWSGILGTYPGTGSGSQALESFHAFWQSLLHKEMRASPVSVFDGMQRLFKEHFEQRFQWGVHRTFDNFPKEHARDVMNGGALRTVGRSPAVDYWTHRDNRIDGARNHRRIVRRSDGQPARDSGGSTTFYVMACAGSAACPPAQANISVDFANQWSTLVVLEGDALVKALRETGIILGDVSRPCLDVDRLELFFLRHAAVLQGHLPEVAWPRFRRSGGEQVPTQLCTCLPFAHHADCEHIVFVEGLLGRVKLDDIPQQARRGRKRKAV